MPRPKLDDVRKPQLTAAVRFLIADGGLENTSIAQIADASGTAQGMVRHYFGGKDSLIEETLRELSREYLDEVDARIAVASTPEERVVAYVEGTFSPTLFTRENLVVWLVFWGRLPHSSQLKRIHDSIDDRTQATLAKVLSHFMPADEAVEQARMLTVFVDGIWLRAAIDAAPISRDEARRAVYRHLERNVGVKGMLPVSGS